MRFAIILFCGLRLAFATLVQHDDVLSRSFFIDGKGQNCTHVDPEDKSWGWICEEHPRFPHHNKREDPGELVERAGAFDAVVGVATIISAAFGLATFIVVTVASVGALKKVTADETAGGNAINQCLNNRAGNAPVTLTNGDHAILYYCLSKNAGKQGCGQWLSDSEATQGSQKAVNYFNNHEQAKGGCIDFEAPGSGLNIRGKFVISRNNNPNINACSTDCGQFTT